MAHRPDAHGRGAVGQWKFVQKVGLNAGYTSERYADRNLDHIGEAQITMAIAFPSTDQELGVALEEWNELKYVIGSFLESIRDEAIDLAAVLIRLANQICGNVSLFKVRSKK